MARIKKNLAGVDAGGGKALPSPAVYTMTVVSAVVEKPSGKDERIYLKLRAKGRKWKGYSLVHEYINTEAEASAWKLVSALIAFGDLPKDPTEAQKKNAAFDPDEWVDQDVKVLTRPDSYQGQAQAKVARLMPLDYEDDDEDEPDTDAEDGDEDSDEELEEFSPEELDDMDLNDLIELAESNGLDADEIVGRSRTDSAKTRKLVDALAEFAEEQGWDGDDEDDEDDEEIDYSEMDLVELKAEAKERGLKTTGSKKLIIKRLEEDDEDDEDEV